MKKQKRAKRAAKKVQRWVVVATVAGLVIAIGAITVLSRQSDKRVQAANKAQIVNARLAAQDQPVQDPQPQQLSADEAQKIASGMKELVNQSTEGLVEVQHADGSVSVDLQDRFQNVTVAKVNKDGSVSTSCVDNPQSAGAFFGIDPKLIDPTAGGRNVKPVKVPARNKIQ